MRRVGQEREAEVLDRRAERHQLPCPVRLVPRPLARRKPDGVRIVEAAHAAQRAEVVVERAVLLHEDHDVLDVGNGAGSAVRGDRERTGDARRHGAGDGARPEHLQEGTARGIGHEALLELFLATRQSAQASLAD